MIRQDKHSFQVAVDGPAGAGKSTVAKAVARRLGLLYLDTGAMYRALTYKLLSEHVSLANETEVTRVAQKTEIFLEPGGTGLVWCDGEDVTQAIRLPEVSRSVSIVAAYPGVRRRLVELQQEAAGRSGVVMDGRDIGTHVLPGADLKIFLTASPEERARRRWLELTKQGRQVTFEEVALDMNIRDRLDSERETSPLEPAPDAVILDTTGLEIEEIVIKIVSLAGGN